MSDEFKNNIVKTLEQNKKTVVQVRDDEIDWLLKEFPNAVLIERINNYSNFSISTLPTDSPEDQESPEKVYMAFYRDGHYTSQDISNLDQYFKDFAVKYQNFQPELHAYTRKIPEFKVEAEWPAFQSLWLTTFYENGHWHSIRRDCKDSAESFARSKQRHGIKCAVTEYFYAGEIE